MADDLGGSNNTPEGGQDEEDESANWDPFEDAHKFEALHEKQEVMRKREIQEQFNTIATLNKEQSLQQELMEKTQSLEESVNTITAKLTLREEVLKQKEEAEQELRLELNDYQKEIENKNREIKDLSQVWIKLEKQQISEAQTSGEMLSLISKLQQAQATNTELTQQTQNFQNSIIKLEMEKQRLVDESLMAQMQSNLQKQGSFLDQSMDAQSINAEDIEN